MCNILKYFINDWYPVWSEVARWMTSNGSVVYSHCTYIVEYSTARNKYRLKTLGYSPKLHPYFGVAVKKLNEFMIGNTKPNNDEKPKGPPPPPIKSIKK